MESRLIEEVKYENCEGWFRGITFGFGITIHEALEIVQGLPIHSPVIARRIRRMTLADEQQNFLDS